MIRVEAKVTGDGKSAWINGKLIPIEVMPFTYLDKKAYLYGEFVNKEDGTYSFKVQSYHYFADQGEGD